MELREAEKKIQEIIQEHIPTWHFEWDNAKRRFGCTHYNDTRITLSRTLVSLNDWETVRLTVLHEVAHALVGHIHHHDNVWKMKCLEIGGDGKRCYDGEVVNTPTLKYSATCPVCGHVYHKARKPKCTTSCGKCCKVFSEERILDYTETEKQNNVFSENVTGQYSFAF